MSYLNIKGIVIREVNVGEADKIITLLTKQKGKITVSAKGARRPKSSFAAGTQFLSYSDFMLFSGKDMYSLNSCDIIEPFYEIRNDMEKLTYAAHFVELVNDTVQENQPAGKVLQLFLNTLHMLAKTQKQPELLARIFELRLLTIDGYTPYVRGCTVCGRDDCESYSFSFLKCGLICDCCSNQDPFAIELSSGSIKALTYIVYSKIEELFSFNVSQEVLDELEKIMRRYLRERLEKDYTKLDFLKQLKA
jgi:DNA repair protein RecO (recombination protein O)